MITMLTGDCRALMATLPDASVHCVVTSPPYWGLRDYGTAQWEGGDPACAHIEGPARQDQDRKTPGGRGGSFRGGDKQFRHECPCGAVRMDAQLGLEPDFNAYVANMVAVFREVRRVLRDDGTLWLNLGDSYAAGGGGFSIQTAPVLSYQANTRRAPTSGGLKPKDLCGIPWRVAFALHADGWYLRQDIIWSKPNPMPESVTDRCTKAHEYLFLLSKRERYYYDAEAISEEGSGHTPGNRNYKYDGLIGHETKHGILAQADIPQMSRNKRSVWEVTTAPFSEAHFATFPPALIEPCIKAGTSEKGCCGRCGKPWVRKTKTEFTKLADRRPTRKAVQPGADMTDINSRNVMGFNTVTTLGWLPSCACNAEVVPCTVLDPFGGAGTTGLVADRLQRSAILIELNPTYAAMSTRRITDDAPLFADVVTSDGYNATDDFAKSIDEAYRVIRERKANGGKGWEPP